MRLLGIETSDNTSSVALFCAGRLHAEDVFYSHLVLCDQLTPRITKLLEGDWNLDGIAVSCGPGSFTGLRIGVSTAKALGHALGVPVVGVPTQHVLAAGCGPLADRVAVIQKARRGHVYAGLYRVEPDGVGELQPVQLLAFEQVYDHVNGARIAVGDGLTEAAQTDHRLNGLNTVGAPYDVPRAAVVLRLADWPPKYSFAQLAALRPQYLLASQAERIHGIEID